MAGNSDCRSEKLSRENALSRRNAEDRARENHEIPQPENSLIVRDPSSHRQGEDNCPLFLYAVVSKSMSCNRSSMKSGLALKPCLFLGMSLVTLSRSAAGSIASYRSTLRCALMRCCRNTNLLLESLTTLRIKVSICQHKRASLICHASRKKARKPYPRIRYYHT